jgi:hypothetical protein
MDLEDTFASLSPLSVGSVGVEVPEFDLCILDVSSPETERTISPVPALPVPHPAEERQAWRKAEDAWLCALVGLHGRKWARIAKAMGCDRSADSLRNRWIRLKGELSVKGRAVHPEQRRRWSKDEDANLAAMLLELSGRPNWKAIAAALGTGRKPGAVKNRALRRGMVAELWDWIKK